MEIKDDYAILTQQEAETTGLPERVHLSEDGLLEVLDFAQKADEQMISDRADCDTLYGADMARVMNAERRLHIRRPLITKLLQEFNVMTFIKELDEEL